MTPKLEYCQDEVRALLVKLQEGHYGRTAQFVYDHIAKSGVELAIDPELEDKAYTLEEFLDLK